MQLSKLFWFFFGIFCFALFHKGVLLWSSYQVEQEETKIYEDLVHVQDITFELEKNPTSTRTIYSLRNNGVVTAIQNGDGSVFIPLQSGACSLKQVEKKLQINCIQYSGATLKPYEIDMKDLGFIFDKNQKSHSYINDPNTK